MRKLISSPALLLTLLISTLPASAAAYKAPPVPAIQCHLVSGSGNFPNLMVTNAGMKGLEAGQIVDLSFSYGIMFALTLQHPIPPGQSIVAALPDAVNGIPQGTCAAKLPG